MTTKKKIGKVEEPMSLHEGLRYIQANLKTPKGQVNSFGGYNYRSCEDILAALKPLLTEASASLTLEDEMVEVGGRVYVKSTATLSVGIISTTNTAFAREPLSRKGMDESQITGAASSYARKYALAGLFAIDSGIPDADTKDNTDTESHRFKPGEADEILAQGLACLEMDDDMGLREVLEGYADDPDVKVKVWQLFSPTQRSSMKKLLNGE